MSERVIDKIKKLLALSANPNQNEAESALAKAQELAARHNLDLDKLRELDPEDLQGHPIFFEGGCLEVYYLKEILKQFFFCLITREAVSVQNNDGDWVQGDMIQLHGEPHNLEIGEYVLCYCVDQYRKLWQAELERDQKQSELFEMSMGSFMDGLESGLNDGILGRLLNIKKPHALDPESVKGYYTGLTVGIYQRLEEQQVKQRQEWGLVPVISDKVEKSLSNLPKEEDQNDYGQGYGDAYQRGKRASSKIQFQRAIQDGK